MITFVYLFLIVLNCQPAYTQFNTYRTKESPVAVYFGQEKENGFLASVSLVTMFTTGAKPQNGIRIGFGVTLSQTIDKLTLSTGLDMYKAQQKFGMGTTFAGVQLRNYHSQYRYDIAYYLTQYFQGDKQMSGLIRLNLNDFWFAFEDDILAYPFTGFKVYDRYRSAGMELRYKGFVLGTNVYTSDINGVTDVSFNNRKGVYANGQQISSPVYVGYATHDLVVRIGINNQTGGIVGQNSWHRLFFNSPDFKTGDFLNPFLQFGVNKPYTLF